MFHDLTKGQKRALREAAALAHQRDLTMPIEDRDVHYLEARNADLPLLVAAAVVDGFVAEDEIREPARDLIADLTARIRALRESIAERPATQPRDPYVPDAPVSVKAILELVDMLSDLSVIYVNRKTGETEIFHEDEVSMLENLDEEEEEDEEEEDDLPQWEQDSRKRVREIRESDDWLEILTRMDLDEFGMMKKFALSARPSVSKALLEALNGRGAFRRFRGEIHRFGIEAEWDAFRTASIEREIRNALDAREVQYRR
jgi:hypothetical protein